MLIVKFQGGLANQLFDFAFLLKLKCLFKEEVFADISSYESCNDHGGYKIGELLNELKVIDGTEIEKLVPICINATDKKEKIYVSEKNFQKYYDNNEFIKNNKEFVFCGYWQRPCFYETEIPTVREIFNLIADGISTKNIGTDRNRDYLKTIQSCESVSLHVRRGDYVDNWLHGNISTRGYYQNAVSYFESKYPLVHFFVFSDDMEWCKCNICFHSECTYIVGNETDEKYDLLLMSRCKHNIISNSSFSWWAQVLNSNKSKIVVTPECWFNDEENYYPLSINGAISFPSYQEFKKKSDNPLFSILIPAYNVEKTISCCLISVINQTFDDFEVIIVDDASLDATSKIIDTFAKADNRIRIIKHKENQGLLCARISAMREMTGRYALLLDSDDYLSDGSLEKLSEELNDLFEDFEQFGMLCLNYVREPSKIVDVADKDEIVSLERILRGEIPPTVWNKVYSSRLIKDALQLFDEFRCTYGEDLFFSIVFLSMARNVKKTDAIVHHYRVDTGVTSKKKFGYEFPIERYISSIEGIRENLIKFSMQDLPSKVNQVLTTESIDICVKRLINNLFLNCLESCIDEKNKLFCISQIDNHFGTNFSKEILEKAELVDRYKSMSFRRKISVLLKEIMVSSTEMFKRRIFKC